MEEFIRDECPELDQLVRNVVGDVIDDEFEDLSDYDDAPAQTVERQQKQNTSTLWLLPTMTSSMT